MEKFGLLNLLKAIETLTPKNNSAAEAKTDGETDAVTPPPAAESKRPDLENNVMANVLSRHEQVANRIKNNRR